MSTTLGERIRVARENAGLHQEELAKAIEVNSGRVISNWENSVARPDADKLVRLCNVLNVSAAYLLGTAEEAGCSHEELAMIRQYRELDSHGRDIVDCILKKEHDRIISSIGGPSRRFRRIPYYESAASAGTGLYLEDVGSRSMRVPLNSVTVEADFVIPIRGDSMEPMFSNGDKVCVKVQQSIEEGEIGVFLVNGDAFIKQYQTGKLVSLNEAYSPIVLGAYDSVFCKGRVLGRLDTNDFSLN